MKTVKLRIVKDFEDGDLKFKKGQIIDVSAKHYTGYIKGGVADLVEKSEIKENKFEITKEEAIKLNKTVPGKLKKEKKQIEPPKEQSIFKQDESGKILFKEPVLNGNEPKWLLIKERMEPPNKQDMDMILKGELEPIIPKIFSVSEPNQWKCMKCCGTFHSDDKPIYCPLCNRETHFEHITKNIDTSLWKLPSWEDIKELDMQNTYIDLKNILKRTIIFPDELQYDIFALWIIATWKKSSKNPPEECWDSVPFLIFRGLIETGKSKALELLYEFGYRAMLCSSITFPAMQRATNTYNACLLIDEIDTKIDPKTENGKLYLDFLKPSYKTKTTYKCADLEDQDEIKSYRNFGFKAFAGEKGGYDEAIFSRSIDFQMEQVYPEIDELRTIQQEINKIQTTLLNYRYKTDNPPDLPEDVTLKGRDREIFSCIIRTAMHIGIDYKSIIKFIEDRKQEKQQEIENSDEYAILKLLRDKECNPTLDDAPESISYSEIAEKLEWNEDQRQKLGYIFKKKLNLKTKRKNTGSVLLLNDEKNINKLKGLYRRYKL
jgi:hypothetical protein